MMATSVTCAVAGLILSLAGKPLVGGTLHMSFAPRVQGLLGPLGR
ncbi:MAG: hypothetical protein QM736_18295 [Vicinamibacterales bacterium]